MTRLDNNKTSWYDTKKELPKKNKFVAVRLNKNWFNSYLELEESEIKETTVLEQPKVYSNSDLKATKELATGLSSRDINSTLTTLGLMEKIGNDWCLTQKGNGYGGVQKEGQYGKFIVWPEQIIEKLELV